MHRICVWNYSATTIDGRLTLCTLLLFLVWTLCISYSHCQYKVAKWIFEYCLFWNSVLCLLLYLGYYISLVKLPGILETACFTVRKLITIAAHQGYSITAVIQFWYFESTCQSECIKNICGLWTINIFSGYISMMSFFSPMLHVLAVLINGWAKSICLF